MFTRYLGTDIPDLLLASVMVQPFLADLQIQAAPINILLTRVYARGLFSCNIPNIHILYLSYVDCMLVSGRWFNATSSLQW